MWTEVADLKGKSILIVGLGKTGISLANFLTSAGANVTMTDHKSKPELAAQLETIGSLPVKLELGGHSPKIFLQQDLVILSPGVPPGLKIFEYARSQGIKVTNEFEFATKLIKQPMIGITGTNGKTTTAQILKAILAQGGQEAWVGGSNDQPLTEYLRREKPADVVIVEVSAPMLELSESFAPSQIVFTNLAESHLDRYRTMEEYINTKRKIFRNTNQSTTCVLNADDNAVIELARDPSVQRGKILYFSRKPMFEQQILQEIGGAVSGGKAIRVRTRRSEEIEEYDLGGLKMTGRHMLENLMAAMLVAQEFSGKKDSVRGLVQQGFPVLPHRLEYVRKVGGVLFYNDSKATNVHAVLRALDAFDENVILIMGGKETGASFEALRNVVRRKVKTLILVGEAKEHINRDLGDFCETFLIGTFEEAVLIAYQKSRIGDIVLLSPGCPSFDLFDSYEERGQYFKEIVRKFK